MTQLAAAAPAADPPRAGLREIGLWAAAAIVIVGAHVAIAYAVQSFSLANMADGGPPPAVAIELSPMMVAPAVQEDSMADVVTPEPPNQIEEAVAELKPVVEPEPGQPGPVAEKTEAVQPAAPIETAAAEQPDQSPPLDEVVPDIVPTIAPDVVIPPPQTKPAETKPAETKPIEKAKKAAEKPKPKAKKEKKEKAAPAKAVVTASVDQKAAAKASAPKASQSSGSSVSASKWNSQLIGWINRHKRYPSAARSRRAVGTANVTFVVSASGKVTSVRLTRSSGDADLDRAALGILQGATVPAPPPEKAGTAVVAPLMFTLRN
ncbi:MULTISPECIES: energy transducer TonB [unclassified Mesorhizobium]|uniref:energy transducer TonB family protein n=1 Tax=unclassified Mesorhizobium TaxID=325217 RepID=UPI0003CF896F|nr:MULTISPECIES: energy transducer TonB [unclassified Mesorhizobium]ESX53971.1 cell envelope biogenesis protein TonB [Mesorhizobium sp. LSHC424B00]ESX67973.1 cell envelope biogenesis protein TonB [Mesorhizobium sp. LSHC416B00]ESX95185.1 cell envelope biogenesis protein TonB [Mesorhizobium sp. LNJC403B00]WJI60875.1 TonB family protein [Mesorhizobium sp. C416B]